MTSNGFAEQFRAHREQNTELRQQIDTIVGRVDSVGRELAITDPRVRVLADEVIAELEQLTDVATQLRSKRTYVTYVPGGGYSDDDAIAHLEAAVAKVRNIIAHHEHTVRAVAGRTEKAEAAEQVHDAQSRVAALKKRAQSIGATYRPDDDSPNGSEIRRTGFTLMADLADALDTLHTLQHRAGQISDSQLRARQSEAAALRATAHTELGS